MFYTTIVNTSPLLNRTSHTHSIGERQLTLCRLFPVMLVDAEPGCRPRREKSLILCETDQPLKRRERAFCLRPTLPILIWGQKFESSWVSMTRECPFLRPVGLSSLSSDRESCFWASEALVQVREKQLKHPTGRPLKGFLEQSVLEPWDQQ